MKCVLLSIFLLLNGVISKGQFDQRSFQKGDFDFGFLVGTTAKHADIIKPGILMGTSVSYEPGRRFALRSQFSLATICEVVGDQTIEETYFEAPIHLLFKPYDDCISPMFSAGIKNRTSIIGMKFNFLTEFGAGICICFRYFQFKPEFRLSKGGNDTFYSLVLNFE